jgi:hypothetical protein
VGNVDQVTGNKQMMKVFIVAFILGVGQGILLCDWYRSRNALKTAVRACESKLVTYKKGDK